MTDEAAPETPIEEVRLESVQDFHEAVIGAARGLPVSPWFRGEPGGVPTPLTPDVFRAPRPGHHHDENNLLQSFRRRAHVLAGMPVIPPQHATDQWLYVARHVGLPTRLLDWTEGALIALFFALEIAERKDEPVPPVIWMLDQHALNLKNDLNAVPGAYGLPWVDPGSREIESETFLNRMLHALGKKDARAGGDPIELVVNPAFQNVQAAWRGRKWASQWAMEYPVPIAPTSIHPRMNAQRSHFTVHGSREDALSDLVGGECLRKYVIDFENTDMAFKELQVLGVTRSTLYPEAEALADELRRTLIVPDVGGV